MPFRLWPDQMQVMNLMMTLRLLIFLKARQLGISWVACAYALWLCIFHDGKVVLIFSRGKKEADEMVRRINVLYERLPDWMKERLPALIAPNKSDLTWSNGSTVQAMAATQDAGSSFTASLVILDEFAKMQWAKDLYTAVKPTIDAGGKLFIISTAKGIGNPFHEMWIKAEKKLSTFTAVFLPWWSRPGRDQAWYERVLADANDPDEIRQEYPACVVAETRASSKDGIFEFGKFPEYYKGESPTIRMRTSLGYQITTTPNHHFMMPDGNWKAMEDIKIGERVCLLPPQFGKSYQSVKINLGLPVLRHEIVIDEDLAEFIGVFMGDGSLYKPRNSSWELSVVFDAKDPDSIEQMRDQMRRLFGKVNERIVGTRKGGVELRLSSIYLGEFCKSLELVRDNGAGTWKRKVHIPDYILKSPKSVVSAFLRGLFDADGFAAYNSPRVVLFSKYEDFIRDVQFLLLGFGVTSKLNCITKKASDGHFYEGRELQLRKNEAVRFMSEIGFISSRKNDRWNDREINHKHAVNTLPLEMEDAVVLKEDAGMNSVYDMEVVPEHYYSGNGFWIHNSSNEAFVSSGTPRFLWSWLQQQVPHIKPPTASTDAQPELFPMDLMGVPGLSVYEWPHPHRSYCMGADPAEGIPHGDFSVATVVDADTWEEVAVLDGKFDPTLFAHYIAALGNFYNEATLVVGRNNHGQATLAQLVELNYPNIAKHPKDHVRGWPENIQTKVQMVDDMAAALKDGVVTIHSQATLDELQMYQKLENGKTGAPQGYNDDRCSSWFFLAAYLSAPRPEYGTPAQDSYLKNRQPLRSSPAGVGVRQRLDIGSAGKHRQGLGREELLRRLR